MKHADRVVERDHWNAKIRGAETVDVLAMQGRLRRSNGGAATLQSQTVNRTDEIFGRSCGSPGGDALQEISRSSELINGAGKAGEKLRSHSVDNLTGIGGCFT